MNIQGSLLLASSLSSLKLLIFWRLGVVSRLLKLVMQNLHFAKLGQRQVRPRLGSSFQHAGVQECCGINLPEVILQHVCPMWRGRNGFGNQSWITRRYVHLAVRHSSPPLCVTVSGGSSRTTAVGSGSDLAAALSLPQLGIFRKWPGQWRSRMEMPWISPPCGGSSFLLEQPQEGQPLAFPIDENQHCTVRSVSKTFPCWGLHPGEITAILTLTLVDMMWQATY